MRVCRWLATFNHDYILHFKTIYNCRKSYKLKKETEPEYFNWSDSWQFPLWGFPPGLTDLKDFILPLIINNCRMLWSCFGLPDTDKIKSWRGPAVRTCVWSEGRSVMNECTACHRGCLSGLPEWALFLNYWCHFMPGTFYSGEILIYFGAKQLILWKHGANSRIHSYS